MNSKDLDKFYTKKETALYCIHKIENIESYDKIIEPSAGNGSFSLQLTNCEAYDIEPGDSSIAKIDFFTIRENISKRILVIGNPPFGKKAKLAIDFFNHASFFATTIAFIVPLQFRKWSVQKNLDFRFKLVLDIDIPKNSFYIDSKEVDVNCCFQIWTLEEPTPEDMLALLI
jgi:predicted RNA methylase